MFAWAPAASFDQGADNIALELCGAEESHVSGLSIWILIFGFITMLIAISTFQNMSNESLDTWNSLVNTRQGQLTCVYVEPSKAYIVSLS